MNKMHTFILCIIVGAALATPYLPKVERKRREIDVVIDDNTGQTSSNEQNAGQPQELIFEIIPTDQQNAQTNEVLVIDEVDGENDELIIDEFVNDMEVAETHIFRPLFRYRGQLEQRRRVQQG